MYPESWATLNPPSLALIAGVGWRGSDGGAGVPCSSTRNPQPGSALDCQHCTVRRQHAKRHCCAGRRGAGSTFCVRN